MKYFHQKNFLVLGFCGLGLITTIFSQTHIPADPFYLLQYEKAQFKGLLPMRSNVFRPIYFNTDSTAFSISSVSLTYVVLGIGILFRASIWLACNLSRLCNIP